jgi:hypothetical protein
VIDVADHYRSVELSHMRKLMKYGEAQYREDWDLCIALAQLLGLGHSDRLEIMLDSCFKRIEAYHANNPDARPFELPAGEREGVQ